jgi:rubrerythrin
MENETKIGMNRTGMQMSPFEGPDQVEFARQQMPNPAEGGVDMMAAVRAEYISQAPRIGSVPVPGTGKGMLETAMGKIKGKNPEVLIDKLGQRLAYERSGVRLYQAMITKVQAGDDSRRAELAAALQHICNEEAEHFRMLTNVMAELGADPTAQTPCADVSGVASMGLLQVVTDPRTTVAQSLEAMLTAELTDNAAWEILIELTTEAGYDDIAARFSDALAAEQQHLSTVKQWLRELVMSDAT